MLLTIILRGRQPLEPPWFLHHYRRRERRRKRKKKTKSGHLASFWFGSFVMLYHTVVKTLQDEWYVVIQAYCYEILRLFGIIIYCMSTLFLHNYRSYRLYDYCGM